MNLAVILIFLSVSGAFFWPYFEGKRIYQSDMVQNLGMSREITRFETLSGSKPLRTNAMFGAMPSYQITTADRFYQAIEIDPTFYLDQYHNSGYWWSLTFGRGLFD